MSGVGRITNVFEVGPGQYVNVKVTGKMIIFVISKITRLV